MYELHFSESGQIMDGYAPPVFNQGATDVLVLAHGWNNNADQARELFHGIESQLLQFGYAPPLVGIFWPSKKFDSDLGKEFTAALDSPMARQILVGAMRAAVPQIASPALFHLLPVETLLRRLAGTQPLGQGLLNLSNLTTFYRMKGRAGLIGREGLAPVLDAFSVRHPGIRIHLAGHSFGARLVTAAADAVKTPVRTMTLLQGAFSHTAFAPTVNGVPGAFRQVLVKHKVAGPIAATHTRNDQAVGLAYALASRVAGQEAAFLGDSRDRFGGIGSNGAIHTPEAVANSLLPVGSAYVLDAGKIHNLRADTFIKAHSDIVNPQVAWLLHEMMAA